MVVFICDGCQESLNRGKVRAHMARCRSCFSLSCVDCGARFDGNAYEKHITCMSESQKYAGAKDSKQDEWARCVMKALDQIKDVQAKRAFDSIVSRIGPATVPKKKQKFVNLCKSSQGHLSEGVVNSIWESIEAVRLEAIAERERIKQEELAKKKQALEQKSKEESEKADSESPSSEVESDDMKNLRKRLKAEMKKDDSKQGILLRDLATLFGRKKVVKRIVKEFPDEFCIENTDDGKRVKRLRSGGSV